MIANAAGVFVPRAIFDLITPIEVPHGGANNAAIKFYDISITRCVSISDHIRSGVAVATHGRGRQYGRRSQQLNYV